MGSASTSRFLWTIKKTREFTEEIFLTGQPSRARRDYLSTSDRHYPAPHHHHSIIAKRTTRRYLSLDLYDGRMTFTLNFLATLLSLVCKRWRLVILPDLTFWSDIDISRHQKGGISFNSAFEWAVTCADRSYPTPMSLSVTDVFGGPEASAHPTHFINNNGQRIHELQVYLRMTGGLFREFEKLQSPMPNLEVLEIGCSLHWGTPPGVALPNSSPTATHVSNTSPFNTLQQSPRGHSRTSSHSS